ncbi:TNF receptor-associated factor 6-like isoform X3 [Amblyomma americanum]
MAPGSMQYTLVGFSAELDWRPLHFVKPIPLHSVCGACGLVRKRSALLPCSHTLCESCYEQSARDGVHVCPLDGRHFDVEDVFLKEFPVGEFLKREVKCWNEGSDCGSVLPASQIGQHFHRECRHHSIRCPRCSTRVLCTDVCAHLESECCTTTATPAGLESQGDSDRKEETALLTSFKKIPGEQAGDIKTVLQPHLPGSGANNDRLSDVLHGVNNCQKELRELREGITSMNDRMKQEGAKVRTELGQCAKKCSNQIAAFSEEKRGRLIASSETIKTISNCMHAMEELLRVEVAKLVTEIGDNDSKGEGGTEGATEQVGGSSDAVSRVDKVVLEPPDLQASVCEFVLKDVGSIEEKAHKEYHVAYESERVYLRGYCMSPGVRISGGFSGVFVSALFRLHQGDMDDVVQWPFKQRIKLRVVHPKGGEEREIVERLRGSRTSCLRPEEGRAQNPYTTAALFSLKDLIREGYVEDDQLRMKFELLP